MGAFFQIMSDFLTMAVLELAFPSRLIPPRNSVEWKTYRKRIMLGILGGVVIIAVIGILAWLNTIGYL